MTCTSLRLSLLVLGISTFAGCAASGGATDEPMRQSSSPLLRAPLDTNNPWSVGICPTPLTTPDGGTLTGTDTGNCTQPGACTGSLVAPNLVLTARHCVEGLPTMAGNLADLCTDEANNHFASTSPDITNLRVTTSPSVRTGTPAWRKAKAVHLPSGVNACSDDVAFIELGENIPDAEAKPAAADIFTDVAVNKPTGVAIVGRGVLDIKYDLDAGGLLSLDRGDSLRRIVQNIPFLCASNTTGVCQLDDFNFGIPEATIVLDKGVFVLGQAAAPGDSGAGVLDQTRFSGGLPAILGVFSYAQTKADGVPGDAFAPRLSVHKDFIVDVATAAANAGGYATPAWVTAPPELAPPHDDAGTSDDAGADAFAPPGDVITADGGTTDTDGSGGCSASRAPANATSGVSILAMALAGALLARRRRRQT